MIYKVEFTRAAEKQVRKLPRGMQERVVAAVGSLELNPRPVGCKKLVGKDTTWRIRVGDYRVIYDVLDDVLLVTVVRAAHRRDAYRQS